MKSTLAGRVRNTPLAAKNALLPLFEAVVNSVDSIQEFKDEPGQIEVIVKRQPTLAGTADDMFGVPDISEIIVTDDGAGFTEANYSSFNTLDSLSKQEIGGKGVGRLVWLVAFERAEIESEYEEAGEWRRRRFSFRRTDEGVEDMRVETLDSPGTRRTTVRLIGYHSRYRVAAPKTLKAIAKRLVEHCLVLYMLELMPRVLLREADGSAEIDLSEIYHDEIKRSSSARTFVVGPHEFAIRDLFLRATSEADSEVHFCANGRVVKSVRVGASVSLGESPFFLDGEDVRYAACITGNFLDERVDPQRTHFLIDHEGELEVEGSQITWENIQRAAFASVDQVLEPHLANVRDQHTTRVREFVQEEEPRYRLLFEHKADEIAKIPAGLSNDRLEIELHKIYQDWRHEAKVEAAKRLASVPEDQESVAQYADSVRSALGTLSEVAKADLAEYVLLRKTVLDFFQQLLGLINKGNFEREDALHSVFFPLRKTSDEIDYEDHNLWLIDERLAFHQYLASDLPFTKHAAGPVSVDSKTRPDLLIYNKKLIFAGEETRPFSSVVIVEFKRPERNDYTEEKNPVTQVMEYVREIRAGRAKNPDGSFIDNVDPGIPFFCYIIASLSPSLREHMDNLGFTKGPDGQSYFWYNAPRHAFIEVSSYSKVLQDALKRNKAFFHKLGLPTHLNRG